MDLQTRIKEMQKRIISGEDVPEEELAQILKESRLKYTADQSESRTRKKASAPASTISGEDLLNQLL